MLSEPVKITSTEPGLINIEPYQAGACRNCGVKTSCGQYLLVAARMVRKVQIPAVFVLQHRPEDLQQGDLARMEISNAGLVKLSLLLYLLPLVALLFTVLLSGFMGLSEAMTVLVSFSILGLSFRLLHKYILKQDFAKILSLQLDLNEAENL